MTSLSSLYCQQRPCYSKATKKMMLKMTYKIQKNKGLVPPSNTDCVCGADLFQIMLCQRVLFYCRKAQALSSTLLPSRPWQTPPLTHYSSSLSIRACKSVLSKHIPELSCHMPLIVHIIHLIHLPCITLNTFCT